MPAFIDPTGPQVQALAGAAAGSDEPVFMLNLLRFKEQAEDGTTGAETYGRYAMAAAPCLAAVGGEIVWSGACSEAVIGPGDPEWDVVAVVRYPSRQAFLDMLANPEYQQAHPIRSSALSDSRLVPCQQAGLA